jgi:hypothetical protein
LVKFDGSCEIFIQIKTNFFLDTDSTQKAFQFSYTENIPEETIIHPQQTLSPEEQKQHKVPGQERITIVEDIPFPRTDHLHSPTSTIITKRNPFRPWIECTKNSCVYHWIHKQVKDPDNRYAFQMGVAFTMAAILVIVEPVSNIFPNVFWVGKRTFFFHVWKTSKQASKYLKKESF